MTEFIGLRKREVGSQVYLQVQRPWGVSEEIPAPFKPYFFVESKKCEQKAIDGTCVEKVEVDKPSLVPRVAKRYRRSFEADIPFNRRVTTDLGWQMSKDARIGFVDIEADDSRGFPDPAKDKILSIAVIKSDGGRRWFYIGDYDDEAGMLRDFVRYVSDVSVLVAWNGGEGWDDRAFDFPYMASRGRVLGVDIEKALWWAGLVDLMVEYKKALRPKRASLEYVASKELGEHKVDIGNKRVADLTRRELEEYNMHDAELLQALEEKYMFAGGFLEKMRASYQPLPTHGTIRVIDTLILRKARELGMVLPNAKENKAVEYKGAMVIEPTPGVYTDVVFYDVNSLYPSIIVYERVSPDVERRLYPELVKELMDKRFEYKRLWKETGKAEYYTKQYAYKILINAFYGALANPHFRLFDASLAEYVARRGREILTTIREYVESLGFRVLYGDTDSVAVRISPKKAKALEKLINRRLAPYSVKVDKVYQAIIFPQSGGRAVKKRYAGLTPNGDVEVTGFEVVRGDAFDLLKEFAEELLRKVLLTALGQATKEEIIEYADDVRRRLFKGEFDYRLGITKKFRDVDSYKANTPQVRALRKLQRRGYNIKTMRFVTYYWMVKGKKRDAVPEPLLAEFKAQGWVIDYKKYWELLKATFDRIVSVIGIDSRFLKGANRTLFGGM